jgi:hypothetical protein
VTFLTGFYTRHSQKADYGMQKRMCEGFRRGSGELHFVRYHVRDDPVVIARDVSVGVAAAGADHLAHKVLVDQDEFGAGQPTIHFGGRGISALTRGAAC